MNDIIFAQKNVREAEYYEKKNDWENAAKYHKISSELFGGLIEGIDNEVDKEYERLKEKHFKRYEYCKKISETEKKKIPKSEPIKIEEINKTFSKSNEDKESEKIIKSNSKLFPKSSSYPIQENKFEPIQKELYVESKNREILIGNKDEVGNNSYDNLKKIIWKGLDLLINGIQGISYFNKSPVNDNLSENQKNVLTHPLNNQLAKSPFQIEKDKNFFNKKDEKKEKKKLPSFNDGLQTVILESSIPNSSPTVDSLLEENEVLRKRIGMLEKKNEKLQSVKSEAKRIIKENQILRDSFINMKNSVVSSYYNENENNNLLGSFIDLLSSSVSPSPSPVNNVNFLNNSNDKKQSNNSELVDNLFLKIKSLEDKCEKQSEIINSYHLKWEQLKKSAKERREKKSQQNNNN